MPCQKTQEIKQTHIRTIVQVNTFQSLFSCSMQQYITFCTNKWNIHISLSSQCHLLSNQRRNIGFDKVSSNNSHQACYTAWSCGVPEWLGVEVWQGHPRRGNQDPCHCCHVLHKHNHHIGVKPSSYCVKERNWNSRITLSKTSLYHWGSQQDYSSPPASYFPHLPMRESARF